MIMEKYKVDLKQEIDDFSKEHRLSSSYRKRKLIAWCVRTILSVILYVIFWKYEWVKWTLVLYIPLTLFNLVMIFWFNRIVDKKANELRSRIDQ